MLISEFKTKTQKDKTIAIQTLGCRLNQYESDGIIQNFIEKGNYQKVEIEEGPDIAIINTCTVTEHADKGNKEIIKKILKKNPNSKIIITGCYAQTDPEKIKELNVALVVGNSDKSNLTEIVENYLEEENFNINNFSNLKLEKVFLNKNLKANDNFEKALSKKVDLKANLLEKALSKKVDIKTNLNANINLDKKLINDNNTLPLIKNPFAYGFVYPQDRVRAYLKIQDGCNKTCSYCKIPQARGKGVSRNENDILDHVKILDESGVPEIILTGVNLGWYRDEITKTRFNKLIEKILAQLKNSRLRLSSIEPCDVDATLAELSTHPKFCNFLHIPLQSGSDKILRKMRRSYTTLSFTKRLEKVRKFNPNIFLGTDIIIGFPGESDEDFNETLKMCRDNEISSIHPFRFSFRLGTLANKYKYEGIPIPIIQKRMQIMQKLRLDLWQKYVIKQIGTKQIAIIESIFKNKTEPNNFEAIAITDNNLKVLFDFDIRKHNFKRSQKILINFNNASQITEEYKIKINEFELML